MSVSLNKLVSIVDDEQDITVLFRDALAGIQGITVFTFNDPIFALEHFTENKQAYGLVISDFKMPGLNGLELLRKMKKKNKSIRTILMTAFTIDNKIFQDYIKKKIIDAYFQKPIKLSDLVKEVNTQLHHYETQKVTF